MSKNKMGSRGALIAVLSASLFSVSGPAFADDTDSAADSIVEESKYTSADVEDNAVKNGRAAKVFIREQAASGRLVDLESVNTSVLPDVTLVWEDGGTIGDTLVETATDPNNPDDQATAVGFEVVDEEEETTVVGEASGTGLEASFNGADYVSGQCYTASIDRGKMTYCGNKYRVKESNTTYNFFFYDRWVTATGTALTLAQDNIPVKIDVRTRPASSGSNIGAMVSYAPKSAVQNCNAVGTLGVSGTGFSASIPFSECDELSPYPDGKTMRVVYDQGAIFGGRVHSAEMGVVYRTANGVTANAAHYNYTKFCRISYATCDAVSKTVGSW